MKLSGKTRLLQSAPIRALSLCVPLGSCRTTAEAESRFSEKKESRKPVSLILIKSSTSEAPTLTCYRAPRSLQPL